MINQKQQKEMLDYLVAKLENNYSNVTPMTRKLSHDIETNYIKLDDGLLILVDKGFLIKEKGRNVNTLRTVYGKALNFTKENYNNSNVGFITYKDGKNFFRSAAPKHHFKADDNHSLKRYSEDMDKMIFFRPEEKFVYGHNGTMQYYQPDSKKLNQGIITYKFDPVILDYSHIDSKRIFKPSNKPSEKDHIWTSDEFMDEDLKLSGGILMPYKK